jgi:hypothetical protein
MSSASIHWMENLMTVTYDDTPDPCSGTMADLLDQPSGLCEKRVCFFFFVCCHPISVTFADGRFERTIVAA